MYFIVLSSVPQHTGWSEDWSNPPVNGAEFVDVLWPTVIQFIAYCIYAQVIP